MITYKFNIGDEVKIIKTGAGCGTCIGEIVTIVAQGEYASRPGYRIDNLTIPTNTKDGIYNGMIGEESFELIQSNINKINKMAINKPKKITKSKVAETRIIDSSLINKDEVFRMLALAEATQLPLLLVGKPGTGKTKTVIEYSKAWLQKSGTAVTNQDFMNKLYILETDEGTKSSEIKGINKKKLYII